MIEEYKPNYLKEDNIVSEIPGLGPEKLDANVSIRGGSGGGAKMLIFTSANSTGIQTFEGFGFTPTSYTITAIYEQTTNEFQSSVGGYDGTNTVSKFCDDTGIWGYSTTYLFRVYTTLGLYTRATHSSFTSDGIKLNFTTSNSTAKLMITAYK